MCGIAGLFNYRDASRPVDRALVQRMTQALVHRGPDDGDFHFAGPLGFGHRRLSIIDLSPTGRQPMGIPDGDTWIIYNGEFYNHEEFRPRLRDKGYAFRGTSDTETLLYLLHSEGPPALKDVAGIFSFAYWDGRRKELLLARDPLGVKQLYFHDDGQRIAFASEIKALLEAPEIRRSPDLQAVNQYLHFHTPLFERTFFQGIHQLLPGQYLTISERGVRATTYWSVDDFEPRAGDPQEQSEQLRAQLSLIVKQQLLSDVPVGAFFSGGIDSSTVASYAAKAGKPPHLFGVHFSNQGVVDERPFQEAAAKALGLDLDLVTLDGSTFADDMRTLIRFQDQPVIGAAMIPMYHVSRLASKRVKVCLGGQAADEIFGGYARYALARPMQVMRSWFSGRGASAEGSGPRVGGNIWKQLRDPRTLKRLGRTAASFGTWRSRYFNNFAHVPEQAWRDLLPDSGVSRSSCWETFNQELDRANVGDPATAAMYWDVRTYLPGLFQQDDRMSMANSLESRVPLADPRLVRFAFKTAFELKFRGGATKWILRQAVADAIPAEVLNRRKVGFDTPAETWMKGKHAGFVRDILLSREARSRGLWDSRAVERLLDHHADPHWFDLIWKCLCVELWAQTFLDAGGASSWAGEEQPVDVGDRPSAGDWLQEVREMGVDHVLFRAGWELKQRSGLASVLSRKPEPLAASDLSSSAEAMISKSPFADPREVRDHFKTILDPDRLGRLREQALRSAAGRIECFSRWDADFGNPIDWQLNPSTGRRWDVSVHWSRIFRQPVNPGDIKLTWEAGRFPQAYVMARAAAHLPDLAGALKESFQAQVESFLAKNPYGYGVHWTSGQEIVFRQMAWVFAISTFEKLGHPLGSLREKIAAHLNEGAAHLVENFNYARKSVYNNHLLSEALGFYLASRLLPSHPESARWKKLGLEVLTEQAEAQFAADGGYIQNSHNYHRVALQDFLWAWVWVKREGETPSPSWKQAMEKSLDFLVAHQNPTDGRLPNYGSNDGSLPSLLSSADFTDFRPTLQAASLAVRGERIYEPGPWDEESAWFLGPAALSSPMRAPARTTVSFPVSGYHVLRGKDESNFGGFRCGTLRDRFSQIDMLHLDVWWRGQNVLVDGGSFLYNDKPEWHDHFFRTASHNTVVIDGRDQMLHFRRFKSVYWTRSQLLKLQDFGAWAWAEGEHYGYHRHPGHVTHRRQVLFAKDGLWVVADILSGEGEHSARLHWLGGLFQYAHKGGEARMELQTPAGPFSVQVLDSQGKLARGTVVAGRENPPRGWLSRYYGEKIAVPSLVVDVRRQLPLVLISVLGGGQPEVLVEGNQWSISSLEGKINFRLGATGMQDVSVPGPS
jgi:asparagine synthase (glutamine-hydrolysing)